MAATISKQDRAHGSSHRRAERWVRELIGIAGPPGRESGVAAYLVERMRAAGITERFILRDRVHRASPFGGECGNLIVKLPGSPGRRREPRRLLMAHMDTVPLAAGCRAVRKGRRLVPSGRTALGGDNRSGCAAILSAIVEIVSRELPHPPLTFLWTVQEEVGLIGARHVSPQRLGRPDMGFNFDGGKPAEIGLGATGAYRMTIRIGGLPSHAGVHPERGVSAAAIAGMAIADLQRNGWHGLIQKDGVRGTSNVGVLQGGAATNVVTEEVLIRAEARSHERRMRKRIVTEYRRAFTRAARSVRNDAGRCGRIEMDVQHDYEAFRLPPDGPVAAEARRAAEALGLVATTRIANGGLDANWINSHGIPTVTLGCGQHNIHTIEEYLDLEEFHDGCRLALALARGQA